MSNMIESPTAVTGPATGAVPGAPLETGTVVVVVVVVEVVEVEVEVEVRGVVTPDVATLVPAVVPVGPAWTVVGVPDDTGAAVVA
jgi:hypothetical protein